MCARALVGELLDLLDQPNPSSVPLCAYHFRTHSRIFPFFPPAPFMIRRERERERERERGMHGGNHPFMMGPSPHRPRRTILVGTYLVVVLPDGGCFQPFHLHYPSIHLCLQELHLVNPATMLAPPPPTHTLLPLPHPW